LQAFINVGFGVDVRSRAPLYTQGLWPFTQL